MISERAMKHAKAAFKIRDFRQRDVIAVIKNYYSRYYELERNPNLGLAMQEKKPSMKEELKWAAKLLKDIRERNALASVAEVDGKVVGVCDVRTESYMEKQHVGSVGISINEGYRSIGIGTALLEDIIRKSRGRFEILRLDLFAINRKALGLYAKSGFKVYGRLPKGYIRGSRRIGHIMMYRRL